MAFISYVPADDASPQLSEYYRQYRSAWGGVDNILRIHSHNPLSMKHHVQLYAHLMRGPSPLSRVQREMIAVTVSSLNGCLY